MFTRVAPQPLWFLWYGGLETVSSSCCTPCPVSVLIADGSDLVASPFRLSLSNLLAINPIPVDGRQKRLSGIICRLFAKTTSGIGICFCEWLTIRTSLGSWLLPLCELSLSEDFTRKSLLAKWAATLGDGAPVLGIECASWAEVVCLRFSALRYVTLRTPIYLRMKSQHALAYI